MPSNVENLDSHRERQASLMELSQEIRQTPIKSGHVNSPVKVLPFSHNISVDGDRKSK